MKKTILVLTIFIALIIALYRWLISDNKKQQKVEETETANEKENVNGQTEEVQANDKVNDNHK